MNGGRRANNPDMHAFPFPASEREESAGAIRAINCYCIGQTEAATRTQSHIYTHIRRIIVNYLRRCRRSCKANSSRRSRRPRVKCTPSTNEFHFISFRTRTFPTRTHTHTHTHRYLRARHPWRVCIQIGQGYGMKWWPGQIGNVTAGPFRPICRHYFPRLRLLFDCSHVMR